MAAASAAVAAKAVPNAQKSYEVSRAELPVSCPMPDMAVWNSHPEGLFAHRSHRQGQVPVLRGGFRAGELTVCCAGRGRSLD